MSSGSICGLVLAGLVAVILLGKGLRRSLPEDHVNADSRDTVKLAMGLIATMTALVLGLLVSSAKEAFDTERNEVIQMAANVAFLDRILTAYGPDANETRAQLRTAVAEAVRSIWPQQPATRAQMAPDVRAGDAVFASIQRLATHDEMQTNLKSQATNVALQIGQVRSLLVAQSTASISKPMLLVLFAWVFVIFLGFSVLAPPNVTTLFALLISALSAVAAIFLLLELDRPFDGIIRISSEPLQKALNQLEARAE